MVKKISIFIILYMMIVLCSFASKVNSVIVSYNYNGQDYKVMGNAEGKYSYIFKIEDKAKTTNKEHKVIKIATLDWPPYIAQNICGQGWVQQVVIAVLSSQGYEVHTSFLPWKRAVYEVESSEGDYDVLYPEYYIPTDSKSEAIQGKTRRDLLSLSDKFDGGELSFFARKDENIKYNGDLLSLKGYKIGVVSGYENSPELDQLIAEKKLTGINAKTDKINIKKLYNKRVDLIVADPLVLRYTIELGKGKIWGVAKEKYLEMLIALKPPIEEKYLYLAFSKKRLDNNKMLKDFNKGLAEFKKNGEFERIKTKYEKLASLGVNCSR